MFISAELFKVLILGVVWAINTTRVSIKHNGMLNSGANLAGQLSSSYLQSLLKSVQILIKFRLTGVQLACVSVDRWRYTRIVSAAFL